MVILLLLTALTFAGITACIAGQRGYGILPFYLLGLLLGPIGLLAILLPRRSHEPEALFGHPAVRA
jgi:hypothetical protein